MKKALLKKNLTADQRTVLELRQELALVASKKYQAAIDASSSDGRLRGGFQYFGAHTGRWAGRRVQLHNLPRAALDSTAEVDAAILDLKLGAGASSQTLKALVRPMFMGPFGIIDYSAIEARVLAWLAGEEWVLEAFRKGRDIYVETAERMGGLTRFQGKVAVLALGYNGSIGSLAAMGAEGDDEQLMMLVHQWRRANPNIVRLWKIMDQAFRGTGMAVGKRMRVEKDGNDRLLHLPSGRAIHYHDVEAAGKRITFANFRAPGRMDTYGGRLVENATQAVARDILAEALVRLGEAGYDVVGHVHDEVIIEMPQDGTLAQLQDIVTASPKWADGLPLGGEGFVSQRYQKG